AGAGAGRRAGSAPAARGPPGSGPGRAPTSPAPPAGAASRRCRARGGSAAPAPRAASRRTPRRGTGQGTGPAGARGQGACSSPLRLQEVGDRLDQPGLMAAEEVAVQRRAEGRPGGGQAGEPAPEGPGVGGEVALGGDDQRRRRGPCEVEVVDAEGGGDQDAGGGGEVAQQGAAEAVADQGEGGVEGRGQEGDSALEVALMVL